MLGAGNQHSHSKSYGYLCLQHVLMVWGAFYPISVLMICSVCLCCTMRIEGAIGPSLDAKEFGILCTRYNIVRTRNPPVLGNKSWISIMRQSCALIIFITYIHFYSFLHSQGILIYAAGSIVAMVQKFSHLSLGLHPKRYLGTCR